MTWITAVNYRENGAEAADSERSRLLEEVLLALQKAGHTCLQRITVSVEERVIVLTGKVPSYYMKQLGQVVVMAVPGVAGVRNELTVERDPA